MLRFHPHLLLSSGSGARGASAGDSDGDEAQEMEGGDEQHGFVAPRPAPIHAQTFASLSEFKHLQYCQLTTPVFPKSPDELERVFDDDDKQEMELGRQVGDAEDEDDAEFAAKCAELSIDMSQELKA